MRARPLLVAGLLSAAGCGDPAALAPPPQIAWVAVIAEDISGEPAAEGVFEDVGRLTRRPPDFSERQVVLGFSAEVMADVGITEVPEGPVRPLEDPCEPELPAAQWAARVPGDGGEAIVLDPAGAPRLTADWLPPRCAAGYACVSGACEPRIAEVAAGVHHACARRPTGEVSCWGLNEFGQVGVVMESFVTEATPVAAVQDALQVSAGHFHSCALRVGGEVWCWGANGAGQLGDGALEDSRTPVRVLGVQDALHISVGYQHACAALADGTVRCWGLNGHGQLGDGTTEVRDGSVQVAGLVDAVEVASGELFSCARTAAGAVRCWGDGALGELGPGGGAGPSVGTPAQTGAVGLSAGRYHACARFETGELLCWGRDNRGQLGGGVPPLASAAAQVAVGGQWSCVLDAAGAAECWGSDRFGQRDVGDVAPFEWVQPRALAPIEPAGPARALSLGERFGCMLDAELRVRCWGFNGFGQLGHGDAEFVATPRSVFVLDAIEAHAGEAHTCLLGSNRKVTCFGANYFGQLGQGLRNSWRGGAEVGGLGPAVQLGAGQSHNCARVEDGTVWCWGYDAFLQVGAEANFAVERPHLVPGVSEASDLALGWLHSCAVVGARGEVTCWGENAAGQLGRDTGGEPATAGLVPGVSGAVQVSAGWRVTCARLGDGEVRCWGNGRGVEALAMAPAVEVRLGRFFGCARHADGKVSCWGINDHGQLGDGSTARDRATPGPVSGIEDATGLAMGSSHACAISESRGLLCWGDDEWHQLGDGDRGDRRVPYVVPGIAGPRAVGLGERHTVVVSEDGQVQAWGWNALGQLGLPPSGVGQAAAPVLGLP